MDLLQLLSSQLNVSTEQAQGGAGLLFKLAKDKLGAGEFAQIADAVPGVDSLLAAAPQAGGFAGLLGGLGSALGGSAGQLGGLASLVSAFGKLDLDASMVGKFLPIVLQYVQAQGGGELKGLLEKVLQ